MHQRWAWKTPAQKMKRWSFLSHMICQWKKTKDHRRIFLMGKKEGTIFEVVPWEMSKDAMTCIHKSPHSTIFHCSQGPRPWIYSTFSELKYTIIFKCSTWFAYQLGGNLYVFTYYRIILSITTFFKFHNWKNIWKSLISNYFSYFYLYFSFS